ncbi:adenylyltransferase and sulfurtransferase MOCS3 [Trichonephila inaurata madagascariensis]|uniref:Adenylyltransferase and sulfurtransferase MOCS3 homolog n=1 Tax=Trichonephila inaurata madagascariensis TaxID=2747483 RepID=A0A8X6XKT7_9ARAC|nr:adenylyltransferase and sulfurtransferase MOCS3 [Trichonephila inaurata madagascariensis]
MEEEIKKLKDVIRQKDEEIMRLKALVETENRVFDEVSCNKEGKLSSLSQSEISRYSRQLILPEIGVAGQVALKQTSTLIVGAGGLGCPVGIYLAAAGIGEIGIIDHDIVEVSNLHRQVAHTVDSVGEEKTKSLERAIKGINPHIKCHAYTLLLNSKNIEKIIESYDIIVDASDNVPTRYLLNDAAVLFNKHLISGSALRFEGQLTVYNYLDGPCYRCLFPKPPSANAVTNCSESGVMGVITGVIGCLQALEVIKIAIGCHPSYFKKMLLFDGFSGEFRVIKLRSKQENCAVCGKDPSIKELIDYEEFCNRSATDKIINVSLLPESERISCVKFKEITENGSKFLLIDVRPTNEFKICSLPYSVNIPFDKLSHENSLFELKNLVEQFDCSCNYVICRRGNDSQRAVLALQKCMPKCIWRDIIGGLQAWHYEIDSTFPLY